jgi:hypothetical protein
VFLIPCYVGPCHNSMERSRIADGGDGLQIRRIAVCLLNKQSRTDGKGRFSSLGVDNGLTVPHHKNRKQLVRKRYTGPQICGNDPSGSIRGGAFLEQLTDCQLLKKESSPWR